MLKRAENSISKKAFQKYCNLASEQFKKKENQYLIDYIKSKYANFEDEIITGRVSLNLNKVIEMINYLAANTHSLYKVKLMKMLWYADSLHFKRNGISISGLAYSVLPIGVVTT